MQRNGWTLLFHACLIDQLRRLHAAAGRGEEGSPTNASGKLLRALRHAMFEVVPGDPGAEAFRQGNTLGKDRRHWRRVRIGQRFRLFFRYDGRARIIVYAWVNDEKTLRAEGARTDPYVVFRRMLARGTPPDGWGDLVDQARPGAEDGWPA
jgi:toxin YhaV